MGRNHLFKPIVLIEGVATIAAPKKKALWGKPDPADTEPLRQEIGVHQECGKPLHFFRVQNTHSLITCVSCDLRMVIPKSIATYGDLRSRFSAPGEKP